MSKVSSQPRCSLRRRSPWPLGLTPRPSAVPSCHLAPSLIPRHGSRIHARARALMCISAPRSSAGARRRINEMLGFRPFQGRRARPHTRHQSTSTTKVSCKNGVRRTQHGSLVSLLSVETEFALTSQPRRTFLRPLPLVCLFLLSVLYGSFHELLT